MKKDVFNLNNPKLADMKNILLESFNSRRIQVIDMNDSRADFFTKKLPLNLSKSNLNDLNEMIWSEVQDKADINFGFNYNSNENFRDELLDDVYILFAMDERNDNVEMIPQALLKIDMYTGNMSLVTISATYDINEIDPYAYVDKLGFSISEMVDEFMNNNPRSTRDEFDDWFKDYTSDLFSNDPAYIKVGRFEFVTAEISEINEFQLSDNLKGAAIENIAHNNVEYKNIHNVREFISNLRQKALVDLDNPKSSIVRYSERHPLNLKTLKENIIRVEQEDKEADNKIHVERAGDEYVVSGKFKGTYAELTAEIKQLANDARIKEREDFADIVTSKTTDNNLIENAILEFSINGHHAGLTQWHEDGYNLYVQLPADVIKIKPTIEDVNALCSLPKEAKAFCIDERFPEGSGLIEIEGKPVTGIMIEGITDLGEVVKMAYEVTAEVLQKMNVYDLINTREHIIEEENDIETETSDAVTIE